MKYGRIELVIYHEALSSGGVTAVIGDILGSAVRHFETIVICRDNPEMRKWEKTCNSSNVLFAHTALRNRFDLLGWLDVSNILRNIRTIRRGKVLHCHLHTPFSCIPIIIVAGIFSHAHIITTEHYISQIKYIRRRELSPVKALLREMKICALMFLKRTSFRFVETIVTVSDSNRDFMISMFGESIAPKLLSIPNGTDTGKYDQTAGERDMNLHRERSSHLVVTVAGLNNQKGHEYLLRAIPSVIKEVPDAKFAFVGDGHLRSHLEELAANLGIANSVEFMGWRSDVSSILKVGDLFVLPSLFEGLPLSLIEAMAAWMPVVATDVDGTHDVVVEGVTGFLVPPKNPEALSQRIADLLGNEKMRTKFGKAGRERAEKYFSRERMSNEYSALYARTLNE